DPLEVLAFEEESCVRFGIDRLARQHRRAMHMRRDAGVRVAYRGEIGQRRVGFGPRGRRHQLPCNACTLGKNSSFHESGLTLIAPVFCMKSAYFMTFCGVVV